MLPRLCADPSPRRAAASPRRRWHPWRGVLTAALTLLLGPGAATGDQPGPADPAANAGRTRQVLLQATDDIARQVASLRGLPLKTPFERGVLSRTEIGQRLRERVAKDYSAEEVRIESGVFKRMGLLPEAADYERLVFDLLTEQVAGFYDPYKKTLYIADWLPLEMQRPALAHEIEHALQDQHFDLKKMSAPLKEDGDRQLARSALVEGDGTAVMLEFAARGMGVDTSKMPEVLSRLGRQMMQLSMATTPALQKAPAVLRESLVFPYAAGLEFITALRQNQTWRRIDEVFRDPPDSTEQVMHPEKYITRERPLRITAAPLTTLAPRREVKRDVLGEMMLRVWFGVRLSDSAAAQAAAGWGGDRLVAYAQEGEALPVVVVLSTWDSDQDAGEAEQAGRKVVLGMTGQKETPGQSLGPSRTRGSVTTFVRSLGGRAYAAVRQGRQVLLLCGVPETTRLDAVVDEVLRTWKVEAAPAATPGAPDSVPAPAPAPTGDKGSQGS